MRATVVIAFAAAATAGRIGQGPRHVGDTIKFESTRTVQVPTSFANVWTTLSKRAMMPTKAAAFPEPDATFAAATTSTDAFLAAKPPVASQLPPQALSDMKSQVMDPNLSGNADDKKPGDVILPSGVEIPTGKGNRPSPSGKKISILNGIDGLSAKLDTLELEAARSKKAPATNKVAADVPTVTLGLPDFMNKAQK